MLKSIVALGTLIAASAVPMSTSLVAQDISEYDLCVLQGTQTCYPDNGGGIFIPTPGSPEEEAFNQCVAAVEQGCAAQYPPT